MSELDDLISRLQTGINEDRSFIKTIRHPKLLVHSLKELKTMIGNDNVKEDIADTISHLIISKMRVEEYPEMKENEVMLNFVLKGEPGVGKTVLATIVGKIFYSLGYIKGGQKEDNGVGGMLKGIIGETNTSSVNNELVFYCIFIFIVILITFLSLTWSFYEKFGGEWTIAALILIFLLILFVGYLISVSLSNNTTNSNSSVNKNVNDKSNTVKNVNTADNVPGINDDDIFPPDDQIVKVVSRDDFVALFVGHSAPKTKKLLMENLGKVLFVDEAYSLVEDLDDKFGNEAATALNLFMSQHKNEIIIIFAGYKNLLERKIFKSQPGLKRRFMYHYECKGYTPEQLFKIFKLQLAKTGWGIINEEEVVRLFIKEKKAFPNSGGDTERLTHFAEVVHSKDCLAKVEGIKLNKLSSKHIEKGIEKLKMTNYDVEDEDEDNLSNLMRSMRQNQYQYQEQVR